MISFAEVTPFIVILGNRHDSVTLVRRDLDSKHLRLPYDLPIFLTYGNEGAQAQIVVKYHPPSRKTTLHPQRYDPGIGQSHDMSPARTARSWAEPCRPAAGCTPRSVPDYLPSSPCISR
ncbi:hypothetical protein O7631_25215 [Micromonospora sp. WMMD967]|uniref:hypothetical protein n=1 Tax=Micromonospora sp. WMMD967 TaxID=3016101 RepID=UPI002415EA70|nr:hypothetical protein [Micromonospora sp. WMMD967]MDG4839842.1 hypothetical protein [Micromonospora sp. WMMD967]